MILNLLSENDLKAIGVDIMNYERICQENNIELINFAIRQMKGPDIDPIELDYVIICRFILKLFFKLKPD